MQTGDQLNVEYLFRLIYDCFHGACYGSTAGFSAFFANLWLWIIGVGYLLAVVGLFVIVYCTVQLFELREREEEFYGTLLLAPDAESGGHPRWRPFCSGRARGAERALRRASEREAPA